MPTARTRKLTAWTLGSCVAALLTAALGEAQEPRESDVRSSCVLLEIELDGGDEEALLEIVTSGDPASIGTRVEQGSSLVLDLAGCVPGPRLAGRNFTTGMVTSLQLVQRSGKAVEPLTAVVVEARQPFEYTLRSGANAISLRLRGRDAADLEASPSDGSSARSGHGRPGLAPPLQVRVLEPVTAATPEDAPAAASTTTAEAPVEAKAVAIGLVEGARLSVARAPKYDAVYRVLAYPGGDPGWRRGSAVDLVIRAYRQVGIDLQQRVHEDILSAMPAYGIQEPDPNIDHRRIRNLLVFLRRNAEELPLENWRPGDLVFWSVKGRRSDHVGIVSDRLGSQGRPLVIHHFEERLPAEVDVLDSWPVRARYRWLPVVADGQ